MVEEDADDIFLRASVGQRVREVGCLCDGASRSGEGLGLRSTLNSRR